MFYSPTQEKQIQDNLEMQFENFYKVCNGWQILKQVPYENWNKNESKKSKFDE